MIICEIIYMHEIHEMCIYIRDPYQNYLISESTSFKEQAER